MRPLRWRSLYKTDDREADRRNREFVDCLNSLIKAAGEREHCREMEEFIGRFSAEAEAVLIEHSGDADLTQEFGRRLLESVPLGPYGTNACRKCGLCDFAQRRVAEHLEAPAQCLFKENRP